MEQEYFFIRTVPQIIVADNLQQPIDLARIGGVIDFSIKNTGLTACTVTINGVSFLLSVGDPMLMLGGYSNCQRADIITISFAGGTGEAHTFTTKRHQIAKCLI